MRPGKGSGAAASFALALLLGVCGTAAHAQSSSGAASAQSAAPPLASSAEAAAAADSASPPADADDTTKKITLPNVNVQGKRNVFNDNDKKIKELQESLPCTGCDAKPHTKRKFVKRVLDAVGDRVLPSEAPDHSDRDPNDKAQEFSQQNLCNANNVGGCVPDNVKP